MPSLPHLFYLCWSLSRRFETKLGDKRVMDGNEGAWTGLSACNAVYIIGKSVGNHRAEQLVKAVAEFLRILPICPEVIKTNLGADHPDFEDSLQIAAAQEWNADLIVTRDKDGFINSPIKVPV